MPTLVHGPDWTYQFGHGANGTPGCGMGAGDHIQNIQGHLVT